MSLGHVRADPLARGVLHDGGTIGNLAFHEEGAAGEVRASDDEDGKNRGF